MHFRITVSILLTLSLLFAQSEQRMAEIGNFTLFNGDMIEQCRVGYRIVGRYPRAEDQLIIFPTWFGGTSEHVENLIMQYNFIDTTAFTIIIMDALGNGISSSPSNSRTQPNALFPDISILDMVRSQHLVLTNILRINHVHAVVGGSMGGMQAFEWMVTYPSYVDKIVAYVSTPRMTSRDLLHKEFQRRLIQVAREYRIPENRLMTLLDMSQDLVARTPEYMVDNVPVENFESYLGRFEQRPGRLFNSYNWESQLKAMTVHDIGRQFDGGYDEALNETIAELLVIVNIQDQLVNPSPALELANSLGSQTMILDNYHGHLGITPEIDKVIPVMNEFLKR